MPRSRTAAPPPFAPMLPTLVSSPPAAAGWVFEVKWDGVRAIATVNERVHLVSRNGNDITGQYPELCQVAEGYSQAVYDGEIVAFDDEGRPSFERLQQRMGVTDRRWAESKSRTTPVSFMVFDLLWLDGRDLTTLPFEQRRAMLAATELPCSDWQISQYSAGDGADLLAASRASGLEGLVAKRLDSVYEPGRRTRTWLKIKNTLRQEFAVVGYTPGEGNREHTLGALLIAARDRPGESLKYAGKVGTGFTEKLLTSLLLELEPERCEKPQFQGSGMPRPSRFVTPRLVAEIEFTEWTSGGMVRHPSFKGLRTDKTVDEVSREVAS